MDRQHHRVRESVQGVKIAAAVSQACHERGLEEIAGDSPRSGGSGGETRAIAALMPGVSCRNQEVL
jgi:hypothetical protein